MNNWNNELQTGGFGPLFIWEVSMKFLLTLIVAAVLSVAQLPVIQIAPGDDPVTVMQANTEPTIYEFSSGVYRLRAVLPVQSGDRLRGPVDAVISGAASVSWTADGDRYYAAWPYNWGLWPLPSGWPTMGDLGRRREVLWVDGTRLAQTLTLSTLQPGQYFVDETADRIYFKVTGAFQTVEVAVRDTLINASDVAGVVIDGLTFRGTASRYDGAAVAFNQSQQISIRGSQFTEHNGGGLGITNSTDITTERNRFNTNGGTGYGGSRLLNVASVGDEANGNNWRGLLVNYVNWSAAGVKLLNTHNLVIEALSVVGNHTHGLWLDTDIQDARVTGLLASGNQQYGAFLEASPGPIVLAAGQSVNNRRGVFIANADRVTLDGMLIRDNTGENILIGGNAPPGRASRDFVTGVTTMIHPASNLTIKNTTVIGAAVPLRYGTGGFTEFVKTYQGIDNTWPLRSFEELNNKYTLEQWAAVVNETTTPPTPTPTSTEVPTSTSTPTPIVTPGPNYRLVIDIWVLTPLPQP